MYHDFAIGMKKGPKEEELKYLEHSPENSYVCGAAIDGSAGFFMKQQLRCGDFIESQYYNPSKGLVGGRIMTDDICAICYDPDDIVSVDEIKRSRNIGGKNPLPICRYCFDKKVEIPCSGGRTNMKQKADQDVQAKRKQLEECVQSGRRKGRKSA